MKLGILKHYDVIKPVLQKAIDQTQDSIECARLIDVMRVLDLSAELVDSEGPYDEQRIIETMFNLLS